MPFPGCHVETGIGLLELKRFMDLILVIDRYVWFRLSSIKIFYPVLRHVINLLVFVVGLFSKQSS